ncbi:hypothetical protein [Mesorhizobium sp. LNJC405B00]|uniref:hypothetical protein n=1 Tax=Mesorhizobium sp. LNJC405B00 TaxID=1287281 RepID=UPI0003CEDB31|nr:hypothetical protein [Mesorhizobium sp. LNJC405B00]ESY01396.1 hypothetical protein X755_06960 [Mesorhizobium sp. LNJC405B00]
MTVFKNCTMTMFTAEGEWDWGDSCEVRISDGSIAVSYRDDGQLVVYEGPELEPGHFKLQFSAMNGRATLHRFAGADILEGHWIEGGNQGMWRIQLDD